MTDTSLSMPAPTPAKDVDAVLAYVGPVFIWTMMKHGDNPSYVWHAKNSAGLFAVDLAITVVLQVLASILPISLFGVFGLVAWILRLAMAAASIFALWQTWNGKQFVIPFVTGFGQKIPLEKWFKKDASAPSAAPMATPAPTPTPAPMAAQEAPVATPVMEAPVAPAPVVEAPAPAPMPAPVAPVMEAPVTPAPVVETPAPIPTPAPEAPVAPAAPVAPSEPTPPTTPAV